MISQDVVLVRYGEIALKDSWTRQSWERILKSNIAFCLNKAGVDHRISGSEGRIFVHTPDVRGPRLPPRFLELSPRVLPRLCPPTWRT